MLGRWLLKPATPSLQGEGGVVTGQRFLSLWVFTGYDGAMNKRKKRIIWALSILSILLLVGGGIGFQRQIREQYWIWKLESSEGLEYIQILDEILDEKIYDSLPAILLNLGKAQRPFDKWIIINSSNIHEWSICKVISSSADLDELNGDKIKLNTWDELTEFTFLVYLYNSNQELITKKLEPYLNNKSEIKRAAAACILFKNREKIEEFVDKERVWILEVDRGFK